MMKKISILISLAASITASYGQSIDFGVKAGLNLTEENHAGTYSYDQSLLAGFNVGGIMDVNYKNFVIQPGLFFTTKGESGKVPLIEDGLLAPADEFAGYAGNDQSFKSRLYYIEIPVNFLYTTTPVRGIGFHFGGGPYFACGIAETDVESNETGSQHTFNYHRSDAGLGAIVGATLSNRFLIDAGFEYGLLNIDEQQGVAHNIVISISGGFLFK